VRSDYCFCVETFLFLDIDLFSDDENEKELMGNEVPDMANDDAQHTDSNPLEDQENNNAIVSSVVDVEAINRSAGALQGRKLGENPNKNAIKVSNFSNNNLTAEEPGMKKPAAAGSSLGGLVVSGIPMSQRQGAPIPNLSSVSAQYKKASQQAQQAQIDEQAERISRSKTAKENKAIKEKMDAEYKQSIEGLSIVGTSANNKK
jgi:hypothetical protein